MSGVPGGYSGTGITVVPYITSTTHNSTVIRWYPYNFIPDNLVYANESYLHPTGPTITQLLLTKRLHPPIFSSRILKQGHGITIPCSQDVLAQVTITSDTS